MAIRDWDEVVTLDDLRWLNDSHVCCASAWNCYLSHDDWLIRLMILLLIAISITVYLQLFDIEWICVLVNVLSGGLINVR